MLHAYLLCIGREYATVVEETERFLPYIDNWAVCDSLAPRAFARHKAELLPRIREWMASEHEYTVRFGIGTLMRHYLDADFRPEDLWWVAAIDREEYYIRMMQAWYFATALAKQWDATLPVLDSLAPWVRQKSIQKALESYRVSDDHKAILRTLR
jgi:3-methyladenine DNA glycosylase AlkD